MSEETTNNKITSPDVMADNVEESEVLAQDASNGETMKVQNTKTNSSNVSEYDSAETYTDRENGSISGSESDDSVIFEREEGDGQESTPAKKVDDDEDKKNPQYIPKRGTFYEHDDRTADDIETPEADKNDKDSKKKVWQDKKEKWNHDRFNDTEQAPKSRSELIAIYGYDIRNEDGPPRARRRRRYGRGPNKYTRNWEDVDAYGKPTVIRKTPKKRRPRSENDETESQDQDSNSQDANEFAKSDTALPNENLEQEQEPRIPTDNEEESKANNPPPPPQQQRQQYQHQQREIIPKQNISSTHAHQNDNRNQFNKNARVGTGRVAKPKREISDSDYRGFTKSRQFKSAPTARIPARHNSNAHNQNNKGAQELERDMGKMSIQENAGNFKSGQHAKHNNQRQGSMPPRLQAEQKGSKRYSSIRQRSLPETTNPPFPPPPAHANYYGNEFNQQNQTTSQPQPTLMTANTLHPPNGQLPQITTQTLPSIPPQVPVTTAPILQAPPQFAPPFTPAPAFLQPGVPPASFIPQQAAPILNYVQGQPQFPQAAYQGYQQPFNAVNQPPPELYQPQGGITYYSPQEQQAAQRAAPPKRPKAAIPIVAPPEHRGRGRTANYMEAPVGMENDNNFVVDNLENTAKYEDFEIAAQ